MKTTIINELKKIEQTENVKIIVAVEAGSRAWGFESQTSDYDIRFIYIRPIQDYLNLKPHKDYINWKSDDELLDIHGWDIKKTLDLLYRSNVTIFEWCNSPIIYQQTPEFTQIKNIIPNYFSETKSLWHYLQMTNRNYKNSILVSHDFLKVKSYLHTLRPILAANYILKNHRPAPVPFTQLVESELPSDLKDDVTKLLTLKKEFPNHEFTSPIHQINNYIKSEIDKLDKITQSMINVKNNDINVLNTLFLQLCKDSMRDYVTKS